RSVGLAGASIPLLVFGVIVIAGRLVGARVPDRFGPGRVASVALALSAVGLVVLGLVPTTVGLIVGTAIFASGVAFTMPALISLSVSRVPAEERGTVVGTTAIFIDVAFGISPVILGVLAVGTGTGATFVLSGVIAAIGSLALVVRREALRHPAVA
ncbi:MAG TPA: MFS transporter, partial [Candidatus Limnocylindrales bacterium]